MVEAPDGMHGPRPKVILVSGGSSGLGNAFCWRLAESGHTVVGTSRKPDFEPMGWELIQLDVMDPASVRRAVDHVLLRHGRIDVLVNNAGVGIQGSVEDLDDDLVMRAFHTNFFGLHHMCDAVLPHMRYRRSGLIVNISSIISNYGLPFRGFYSASKAAVQRYSEALRMELRPFGVHVSVVEPGGYRTNIGRDRLRPDAPSDAYGEAYARSMDTLHKDETMCRDPDECAVLVVRIVGSRRPAHMYRPAQRIARLSVALKRLLPGTWFEGMLWKHYG
ncbi:MAG: SDR family oxidoreductase [Flavobacteriales bacterium]|nr:SDR family oxidoreductase [Flavobacteriales bacterium]